MYAWQCFDDHARILYDLLNICTRLYGGREQSGYRFFVALLAWDAVLTDLRILKPDAGFSSQRIMITVRDEMVPLPIYALPRFLPQRQHCQGIVGILQHIHDNSQTLFGNLEHESEALKELAVTAANYGFSASIMANTLATTNAMEKDLKGSAAYKFLKPTSEWSKFHFEVLRAGIVDADPAFPSNTGPQHALKALGSALNSIDGFGTALNGPERYNLLNRMGAADLVPFFSNLSSETDAEVEDQPPPSRPRRENINVINYADLEDDLMSESSQRSSSSFGSSWSFDQHMAIDKSEMVVVSMMDSLCQAIVARREVSTYCCVLRQCGKVAEPPWRIHVSPREVLQRVPCQLPH